MSDSPKITAPDLTQRPPRSVRCRLGGYVTLPRILDKGRATIAGTNGEYNYDAPFDQHLIKFLGLDPAALREQLAVDQSDGEILAWINAHAKEKRTPWEIEQWSEYMLHRGPDSDEETLTFFLKRVGSFTKTREDIKTWMDLLDVDDYVTFGGKP
ncbi:MAG TPA: DUF5069 domain-containing protein [Chthoniobacterales bacterium]|nr:DUF5069 domain-containing protein [Chthoniobacterales bacterium]